MADQVHYSTVKLLIPFIFTHSQFVSLRVGIIGQTDAVFFVWSNNTRTERRKLTKCFATVPGENDPSQICVIDLGGCIQILNYVFLKKLILFE